MEVRHVQGGRVTTCHDDPATWGAGPGEANFAAAVEGCRRCPLRSGCLTRFAARLDAPDMPSLAGLVVAGLHGRPLLRAVREARGESRRVA